MDRLQTFTSGFHHINGMLQQSHVLAHYENEPYIWNKKHPKHNNMIVVYDAWKQSENVNFIVLKIVWIAAEV